MSFDWYNKKHLKYKSFARHDIQWSEWESSKGERILATPPLWQVHFDVPRGTSLVNYSSALCPLIYVFVAPKAPKNARFIPAETNGMARMPRTVADLTHSSISTMLPRLQFAFVMFFYTGFLLPAPPAQLFGFGQIWSQLKYIIEFPACHRTTT